MELGDSPSLLGARPRHKPPVKPVRLQRRRTKGFKLVSPNGLPVVCVTRGTVYGNPFKIGDSITRSVSIELFKKHVEAMGDRMPAYLAPLRGCNVACFCGLDEECHGDFLLEKANG